MGKAEINNDFKMIKIKGYLFVLFSLLGLMNYGQNNFATDPKQAEFITSDIDLFWKYFDLIESQKNPFNEYLDDGSKGLKDFIPYRIESAKHLLKIVKKKKADYESKREGSYKVSSYTDKMSDSYKVLKDMYENAVFPPTYFVIGAFNSGGTSSDNGLIIGVERQDEIKNIPYIVAHELIHFNQNYPNQKNTLLEQSIKEGSADFIGELISGKHINEQAFQYGNENENLLCREFVEIMNGVKYKGWLYGGKGKKEGRPNDLGYWMGYKISKSYYNKSDNKKEAIFDILNIKDFKIFLNKSGFLNEYLDK